MDNEQAFRALLEKLLRYREGKGEFNFSRLPLSERENQTFDAWQELEAEIRSELAERLPSHG